MKHPRGLILSNKQTVIYTGGNYDAFEKSVHEASGLFITSACQEQDNENSPLYFTLGKEKRPTNRQKEYSMSIDKGQFLVFDRPFEERILTARANRD